MHPCRLTTSEGEEEEEERVERFLTQLLPAPFPLLPPQHRQGSHPTLLCHPQPPIWANPPPQCTNSHTACHAACYLPSHITSHFQTYRPTASMHNTRSLHLPQLLAVT